MTSSAKSRRKISTPAATAKRTYDSPLRRQQAAETRARILNAGAEIAHTLPAWDWRSMTFKAVGQRAGTSERTVHRYFSTERALRDAVQQQLVQESGIPLDRLNLGDFAGVVAQLYRYMSSFTSAPRAEIDAGLVALDLQRRKILLAAVAKASPHWSDDEQEMAAAILDLFWIPTHFERLSNAWGLDPLRATQALGWVVRLVEQAIRAGQKPDLSR